MKLNNSGKSDAEGQVLASSFPRTFHCTWHHHLQILSVECQWWRVSNFQRNVSRLTCIAVLDRRFRNYNRFCNALLHYTIIPGNTRHLITLPFSRGLLEGLASVGRYLSVVFCTSQSSRLQPCMCKNRSKCKTLICWVKCFVLKVDRRIAHTGIVCIIEMNPDFMIRK